MKIVKPLLIALSLSFVAAVPSFTEAKPIGRPTAVASYKTGIYTSMDGRLNIALEKQTGGAVDIQFKSADGSVLYSQHIGKNQQTVRTRLNLNELADGVYQVEVTNGVETTRQTITISTKEVAAPGRVVRMVAAPANA